MSHLRSINIRSPSLSSLGLKWKEHPSIGTDFNNKQIGSRINVFSFFIFIFNSKCFYVLEFNQDRENFRNNINQIEAFSLRTVRYSQQHPVIIRSCFSNEMQKLPLKKRFQDHCDSAVPKEQERFRNLPQNKHSKGFDQKVNFPQFSYLRTRSEIPSPSHSQTELQSSLRLIKIDYAAILDSAKILRKINVDKLNHLQKVFRSARFRQFPQDRIEGEQRRSSVMSYRHYIQVRHRGEGRIFREIRTCLLIFRIFRSHLVTGSSRLPRKALGGWSSTAARRLRMSFPITCRPFFIPSSFLLLGIRFTSWMVRKESQARLYTFDPKGSVK